MLSEPRSHAAFAVHRLKFRSCPKGREKARNNGQNILTIFACLFGLFGIVDLISFRIINFHELENRFLVRNFRVYALLLLAALTGGAFLWGWIYALWQPPVPHHKFIKYGALLFSALILTAWARRRVTRDALGLRASGRLLLTRGLIAFSLMAALLTPLWLFLLGTGARLADPWAWGLDLAYAGAGYLLAAIAVATVEELYFRGLLLSGTTGYWMPVIASALFFAGIHFLNPTPDPTLAGHWAGGGTLLANAALDMPGQWLEQLPRLCLLFLIGLGLGTLRLRTGCLAFCLGAHAAMAFSLKTFQFLTDPGGFGPGWTGADASGGWAGVAWMGILVLGLWRFSPKFGSFFRQKLPTSKSRL